MPGYYVHSIFAPAMEIAGQLRAGISHEGNYMTRGSILFVSTTSHELSDYLAYASEAEYGMGPLHQTWRSIGTAADVYPLVRRQVTMSSMRELAGPVFTEGYAFADYTGNVDLYVRGSTSMPTCRYTHYMIDAREPTRWWSARRCRLIGRVYRQDWEWTPDTCL